MTVSDILTQSYERLGYGTTPATEVTTRFTSFLNQAHREILAKPGMETLRDGVLTVASVASQEYIALPPGVNTIKSIFDSTDNRYLRQLQLRDLRSFNPDSTEGTPWGYAYDGRRAQKIALASAPAVVYAVSSNAGDTTQNLILRGLNADGFRFSQSRTLTGTTPVTYSAFYSIEEAFLSAATSGDVTVSTNSGGLTPENVLISQPATTVYHTWIRLIPVPSAVVTYTVDYVRDIPDFSGTTTQEPLLPLDYHHLLVSAVRMKEYERRGEDKQWILAKEEFQSGLRDLRYWVMTHAVGDEVGQVDIPSQLGSWYPAGS